MFRKAGVMAFAMIAVAVSGCSDGKQASKKNFAGAIERWISENKDKAALCLGLDSGRERGSQDALVLDQQSSDDKKALDAMDVLAANGLLRREEKTEKSWFEVRRLAMFTPTEKGRALILSRTKNQPGLGEFTVRSLCVGRLELVNVGNYTEPADFNGLRVSHVHASFRYADLPAWVKDARVMAYWPDAKRAAAGDFKQTVTMVLTGNGWLQAEQRGLGLEPFGAED